MVAAKDTELHDLAELLQQRDTESRKKDAEIARLNTVVENQAKVLARAPIPWTVELPSHDEESDNGNGSHTN